ncbi:MAG: hypothetical protein IJN74_00945 [Clostridia bacterium]|nr:hypothetical protein [Clostridia bacterium]
MLENLYTTKMSMDKRKLQNRFSKIRSKNGRISKLMALIIFVIILLVMACVSVIIAANMKSDEYAMTENEFLEYVRHPIGSVMAEPHYVDDTRLIFHYGSGLFVMNHKTGEIQFMMSLPKFNVSQNQQGSNILDVRIDKDGKYAYLSSAGALDEIEGYDEYIINLDSGKVKKGSVPERAELFKGKRDTFTTVQNPVGFYSNGCIVHGDKTYYLTSTTGKVKDIELVAVDNSTNEIHVQYLFHGDSEGKKLYAPADIKDIASVELLAGGIRYPLLVENGHKEIEKAFAEAKEIKGGTGCPFEADLVFTKNNGEKGFVAIATDSCAVYRSGKTYYDYSTGDNSTLLGLFGLDAETLHALTFNKADIENAELAVRGFFEAFDKSDLETMKTLVTNDFIADGYIGDYGMCYGMTRATLGTMQGISINEFLQYYSSKPKEQRVAFSENDLMLLKANAYELKVYTVVVTAESNIKGEDKPPFQREFFVICKKQNNGSWLVHKLDG